MCLLLCWYHSQVIGWKPHPKVTNYVFGVVNVELSVNVTNDRLRTTSVTARNDIL